MVDSVKHLLRGGCAKSSGSAEFVQFWIAQLSKIWMRKLKETIESFNDEGSTRDPFRYVGVFVRWRATDGR